jgi:putative photosynthetic complex assembly protein
MSAIDERPFPRGALIAAGFLIGTSLIVVGSVQLMKHFGPPPPPEVIDETQIAETRDLRFNEVGGGIIVVADAASGAEIGRLNNTDGFIRTVLMSMAFDRDKRHVTTAQPVYRLIRWVDTRLTIEDTTTGVRVNLGAFGPANKDVFQRFLAKAEIPQ